METILTIAVAVVLSSLVVTTSSVAASITPALAQEEKTWTEYERGRNYITYQSGNTFRTEISVGAMFTLDNENNWVSYVFKDMGSYYQVQHPCASVRFYDYYTTVWSEYFENVVIYDDRWVVEYPNKQDKWTDTSFYGITRSYEIVSENEIKLIRTGNTTIGQRKESYTFRKGSPCKIEIIQTCNETQTVRFVWKPSGIVANREAKTKNIENKISGLTYYTDDKFVGSISWFDELEVVENTDVISDTHANGRKATITFGDFEVLAGQSVVLDPSFSSDNPTEDGHITYNSSSGTFSRTNTSTDIQFGKPDGVIQRGYVEWDISSIPHAVVITDTDFIYHGHNNFVDAHIHAVAYQPSVSTDEYVYGSIGPNTLYADPAGFPVVGPTQEVDLGASADSDLQDRLLHADWFAIGLQADTETASFSMIYSEDYASANPKPTLYVVYTTIVAPTVTTQAATNVGATTATGNGNITNTGGANCTTRGFCYMIGTSGDPTTANNTAYDTGSFGTGAYTRGLTNLNSGTSYRIRAYAINSAGIGYGNTVQILTKPVAPTSVQATDGTYTDKVVITWTKSAGATGYQVYRGSTPLGWLGDVASYNDTGASAPTITPGSSIATDGTYTDNVALSLSGTGTDNGATHAYKVSAKNATGESDNSGTNTGYRGVGSLTYQWQRSAADSDANYSDISGATTASYDDTGAPADGSGRYYKCRLNATGASQQYSTVDRGYRNSSPDFSISAESRTITPNQTAYITVTVTSINGFSDTVHLSASGIPSFMDYGFSPSSENAPFTSRLSIYAPPSTPADNYNITITGRTDGGITRACTCTLTIMDFGVSVDPNSGSVDAGNSISTTVSVSSLNGYSAWVNLSASISPSTPSIITTFTPENGTPPFNSTLTIQTSPTTPAKTYTITITGTGEGTHSCAYTLTVGGLVGYWKFDEGSGAFAADSSGRGNNGTLENMNTSTCWVTGQIGQALNFDGTNDYVYVGNDASLRLTDNFTCSVWVKRDVSQDRGIVNKFYSYLSGNWIYKGWSIISGSNGKFGVLLGNGASSGTRFQYLWTTNAYDLGWHHVCHVREGGVSRIYVDGSLASGGSTLALAESTRDMHIGDWYAAPSSGFFDGTIDDVRIYNRPLSEEEIEDYYQETASVGYWQFDEGSGSTAADSSGCGNNGTLQNMDTSTCWVSGISGTALRFDGVNDYVDVSRMIQDDFTIEFWVKTNVDSLTGNQACQGNGLIWSDVSGWENDFIVAILNNKLAFSTGSTGNPDVTVQSTSSIKIGGWVHVAVTRVKSTGEENVFVNGVLEATQTGGTASLNANSRIHVGGNTLDGRYFNGVMDELKIYNRALSADEIKGTIGSYFNIVVTPLKTGFRAAITWMTTEACQGAVDYGVSVWHGLTAADQNTSASTYHCVILDGLTISQTYHYRLRMTTGGQTFYSDDYTFVAQNAMNAWSGSDSSYTVNLLVSFDGDVVNTEEFNTWESYLTEAAVRVYDATDGYLKIGDVVICDKGTNSGVADVKITENDASHTTGGNIEGGSPDQVVFLGRYGTIYHELWASLGSGNSGWIIAHELGHYALYLPDEYDTFGGRCEDVWSDICMMSSRYHTELCSDGYHYNYPTGDSCWHIMHEKYSNLPIPTSTDWGPLGNGGSLRFIVVNN